MDPTTIGVDVLWGILATRVNVLLMACTWIVIQTARRFMPERVFNAQWWVRLEPLLALVLCSIGVWIPGARVAGQSVIDTVMVGLILGFVVGQSHKIGLQSVLGKDARLEVPAANTKPPEPDVKP